MQKMVRLLISLIWLTTLILPVQSQSTSVLDTIKKNGVLQVGVREDAVPFGYRNLNNNLTGLCLNFIQLLRKELKPQLGREIISIELFKSTLFNRFELVEDKIIDLECGPNTIDKNQQSIDFSKPFFLTGTQFLVKQSEIQKFNPSSTLSRATIGVLHNTTTQEFIMSKYPEAIIQEFQGASGRRRGIQSLQQGRIDAFASDGILLVGEAVLQGLALGKDYSLVPSSPLDCAYYGLILPKDDPQWRDFVNSVIEKAKATDVFKEWLGVVLPQREVSNADCHANGE